MTDKLYIEICKLQTKNYSPTQIIETLNITDDDYIDYINSIEFFINGSIQLPSIKMTGKYQDLLGPINLLPKNEGYLYIINFNGNRIKLGKSDDISKRIYIHNKYCLNYSGSGIENISIIGPFLYPYVAESKLLDSFVKSGKFVDTMVSKSPVRPCIQTEWFLGKFEDAAYVGKEFVKNYF